MIYISKKICKKTTYIFKRQCKHTSIITANIKFKRLHLFGIESVVESHKLVIQIIDVHFSSARLHIMTRNNDKPRRL